MTRLRHHARSGRRALPLLLLAVLLARLVAPAGFMPMMGAHGFSMMLCSGHGPVRMTRAMPGMHHSAPDAHGGGEGGGGHDDGRQTGKTDKPCGFGGLALPGTAGTDPLLLALALLFIVATVGFLAPRAIAARPTRLRPPLRAPPRLI